MRTLRSTPEGLEEPEQHAELRGPVADRVILVLLAVYGCAVLAALVWVPMHFLPAEDAVILHQYSRNLAEHGAITYYAGGPRTEGATDFGWMVLLAGAMRLGVAPVVFTAVVNVASVLGIAVLLLRLARVPVRAWKICLVAGTMGLLPQVVAGVAGFAVLPEALLLTVLVWAVVRQRAVTAAGAALVLCLFRPDGVLFAGPLLGVLLWRAERGRARAVWVVVAVFALPGVLYFVWRMRYFGALLPLPFLVKADTARQLGVFVPHSVMESLRFLALDVLLLAVPVRRGCLRGWVAAGLLGVPTLFYWSMRLDQNVGERFFFYLPLGAALAVAFCWPSLGQRERGELLRVGAVGALVLLVGPCWREWRSFRDFQFRGVATIAEGLRRLPVRGSLLTTEAGFLAYGSGWVAYDAWGLNTAQFARRLIQPEDVATLRPDLVVVHPNVEGDCVVQAGWAPADGKREWEAMVRNVVRGTQMAGGYALWELPYGSAYRRARRHWVGSEGDQECFFVRRSSADYRGIVALLEEQHGVEMTAP